MERLDTFKHIPRYDTLNIYDNYLQVRQLMGESNTILYSCEATKFNRYGFKQKRFLIVTEEHIWVLEQAEHNFAEHRRVPITQIDAFTVSTLPDCQELIIHVKNDYDDRYLFELPFHKKNLMNVMKFVLKCLNREYAYFEVPSGNLRLYTTSK